MIKTTAFTNKRRFPRIDMTAMVDVALLLLIFFTFIKMLSAPNVLKLSMPPKDEHIGCGDLLNNTTINLVLGKNEQIGYYRDYDTSNIQYEHVSNIRNVILAHLNRYSIRCKRDNYQNYQNCWNPFFLIKVKDEANYGTVVDVLDEMAILEVKTYLLDYEGF